MFLLLVTTGLGLAFAWPHVNDVETGTTAAYPDLKPRTYDASPERVYALARETAETSGGFRLSGHGFGPGGWSVQAVRTLWPLPLTCEVHVKITRHGSRTMVSVRSTSRWAKWDFGQNARNIRKFFGQLDDKLKS